MSAKSLGLEGTFRDTTPGDREGCLINIRGPENVGKTYLPLRYAPTPLVYMNGDRDNSRLIKRLREKFGRQIIPAKQYTAQYRGDIMRGKDQGDLDANAEAARAMLKRFKDEYHSFLKSSAKTGVVDQSKWLWETIRLARFGKLIEIPQVLYSQVNAEMKKILTDGEQSGKIVVFISRIEETWKDVVETTPNGPRKVRRPTGKFTTAGFKEFDYEMEVVIEMQYEDVEDEDTGRVKTVRVAQIKKGITALGQKFSGKKINFADIVAAATATGADKWK